MNKFIVLLRGINVSGQKKIKMIELKSLLEQEGFFNVVTYIQSGNIVLDAKQSNTAEVSSIVRNMLDKTFGWDVKVLSKKPQEISNIVEANPFSTLPDLNTKFLAVTMLEDTPSAEKLELIAPFNTADEQFKVLGNNIYIYCPNGFGRAKISNNFFEQKLKVAATSRNWNTMNKLVALSSE